MALMEYSAFLRSLEQETHHQLQLGNIKKRIKKWRENQEKCTEKEVWVDVEKKSMNSVPVLLFNWKKK